MSSTPSVNRESSPATVSNTSAPASPATADSAPKDNLAQKDALVVLPGNDQLPATLDSEEQPELESPENFKKSKKSIFADGVPDYFRLLAIQQKKDLDQKRDNMETRQKSTVAVQDAQKKANLETDKKINEQAEAQQKSSAKTGFLSIFTKVFSVLSFAIGAAMMFVPGLQGLGVALMVTSAIAFATSFPEVMKGLGDLITKALTPLIGEDAAKKIGPIVAAVLVAAAQIAIMFMVPNPAAVLSTAAAIFKTISTSAQVTQALISGGVGVSLGVNNLKLSDISFALDSLLANSDLFSSQLNSLLDSLNTEYQNMAEAVRKYTQQIDDTPKISAA